MSGHLVCETDLTEPVSLVDNDANIFGDDVGEDNDANIFGDSVGDTCPVGETATVTVTLADDGVDINEEMTIEKVTNSTAPADTSITSRSPSPKKKAATGV